MAAKTKLNLQFEVERIGDSLKFSPEDEVLYRKYVKTLKFNKKYYIVVKVANNKRSLALNAYYWGVVVLMISEATGYEIDEAHEFLKLRFNSERKFNPKTNQELPSIPSSTAILDNTGFIEYYSKIQRWAAQGGDEEITHPWSMQLSHPIEIPDPNQYDLSRYDK